jgi:16S rRNA (guanine966-N2)-methyltransferase
METRPTTDRTKETLFNVLQPWVPGSRFLDLFSGSGSIGIEALSRGASQAVMVEQARKAVAVIKSNLTFTRLESDAVVMQDSVLHALMLLYEKKEVFDCIFMDPPYNHDLEKEALEYLAEHPMLREGGIIAVEASKETDFSYISQLGYVIIREKVYKTNKHVFLQQK